MDRNEIFEDSVVNLLEKNPVMNEIVERYIDRIEEIMDGEDMDYRLRVSIRDDYPNPSFWSLLIMIETELKDKHDQMILANRITKEMDQIKDNMMMGRINPDIVLDKSQKITFGIDKLEDEDD